MLNGREVVLNMHHNLRGPAEPVLRQMEILVTRFRSIPNPTPIETKLLLDFTSALNEIRRVVQLPGDNTKDALPVSYELSKDSANVEADGWEEVIRNRRAEDKPAQLIEMKVLGENDGLDNH